MKLNTNVDDVSETGDYFRGPQLLGVTVQKGFSPEKNKHDGKKNIYDCTKLCQHPRMCSLVRSITGYSLVELAKQSTAMLMNRLGMRPLKF